MAKRRILLVDDEVSVLLTLKAILEISGFDVDTAASAREAKSRVRTREYHMVITDMRMESEGAGKEVIAAARVAPYHPAIALLTSFPLNDDDWAQTGADKMLIKPMQTRLLLQQIEKLLAAHEAKLSIWSEPAPKPPAAPAAVKDAVGTRVASKLHLPRRLSRPRPRWQRRRPTERRGRGRPGRLRRNLGRRSLGRRNLERRAWVEEFGLEGKLKDHAPMLEKRLMGEVRRPGIRGTRSRDLPLYRRSELGGVKVGPPRRPDLYGVSAGMGRCWGWHRE